MFKHFKPVRLPFSDNEFVCGQGSIFKVQAVFNSVWAFTFTFHWALSQLLYAQTLKVTQKSGAILGSLFSPINVHNLRQEYTCLNHNWNHRLEESLTLFCSKSSEPSVAQRCWSSQHSLTRQNLHANWAGGRAGKWEHSLVRIPQIPTVITELQQLFKHKHFSDYYMLWLISRVLKMLFSSIFLFPVL